MVRTSFYVAALAAPMIFAHPGEHHSNEFIAKERAELQMHARHIQAGLDACAQHPKFLAIKARGQARRAEKAKFMRMKRASPMKKRDSAELAEYAAESHNSSTSGYTLDTDSTTLFASTQNASCVLTPKVTEGPYYVTGEYYRSNTVEDQPGLALHLEYQYIDISTCDAAEGLYIEQWHANATGVYSGVSASGNGVGSADPSNLNNTFLRGVQKTDSSGVVAFDTVFPGHYSGRAVHIHMMAHQNGTILSNGTFTSASVSSVGQVFFDQDLISDVSSLEPYSSNTQSVTLNTEDSIAAGEADNFDPFAEYAYLGDSISDGLLGWIHVGIDMSASYTVSPGAYYYGTGGVSGSGVGGGSGGAGGSGGGPMSGGSPPSGAVPSGAIPTGSGGAGAMPTTGGSAAPAGSSTATSGAAGASSSHTSGASSAAASTHTSGTSSTGASSQTSTHAAAASSGTASSATSSAPLVVSSSGASHGRGRNGKGKKGGKGHKSGQKTEHRQAKPTGYLQRLNAKFGVHH
ncbi:hypothetical protein FH972_021363 [Carpinus fangiana]|uniref:Intradiol ring-cleavage dioxygenases domain-containing protein n=1 Tax=Carpinus fangiana TaxID=176857 RepID=A0A5N6KPQ0_9ROSI|nr:hypothetical protein FH972_021363 [Carpinus fangiana]